MSRILGLFRKQPKPTLIISRPIQYITRSDTSYQNEEKDEKSMSRSQSKNSLPPRPGPPSNHRLLIFTYTTGTLVSLTAIILFSIAIPLWNRNFVHRQPPIKTDWPVSLILIPLLLSLFSAVYLLTISLYRRRQLHPPDPFNLILLSSTILLSLIPTLILVSNNTLAHAYSSISTKSSPPNTSLANTNQTCNLTNILTRPCLPVLYLIGDLQIAGIVLSTLVCIAWFLIMALSTWTVIKTRAAENRRKEESRRRRHARRRGHKQNQHRHRRGYGHKHGERGDGQKERRHATSDSSRSHDKVVLPARWEGSNAVQYAQQKVKARETIQMWLADRQV